ncbi:site-2 protease family protein [Alloiococcus sp. CFN-8]|uniref:site-2 protease family protein n=1 Tax=Alloiococcus sp. CFN-8 TaxID=3416081 RepID=UPI003CF8E81C
MFSSFNIEAIILSIPAVLIAFTVHEFAHAYVAYRLGDKSQKFQGRLTLNPFVHVDPMGFIMLLIFGFGWAKPVQVNTRALKNYKRDDLLVSLAGCAANIITAALFAVIIGLFYRFIFLYNNELFSIINRIMFYTMTLNISLALFNLLPLPGLDGFRVFGHIFPKLFYRIGDVLYRYQSIIFFVIIITDIVHYILAGPRAFLLGIMAKIINIFAGI